MQHIKGHFFSTEGEFKSASYTDLLSQEEGVAEPAPGVKHFPGVPRASAMVKAWPRQVFLIPLEELAAAEQYDSSLLGPRCTSRPTRPMEIYFPNNSGCAHQVISPCPHTNPLPHPPQNNCGNAPCVSPALHRSAALSQSY